MKASPDTKFQASLSTLAARPHPACAGGEEAGGLTTKASVVTGPTRLEADGEE